jgi:hypothetical protein
LKKCGFKGEICIIGKNAPNTLIENAKKYSFVKLKGFIENLDPLFAQLSYMLVPHISGCGIRTKLLDALSKGIPVIANTKAFLQLPEEFKTCKLMKIINDPKECADFILNSNNRSETNSSQIEIDLLSPEKNYSFLF